MESKSYARELRIAPRKLRFLLPAIKKMDVKQALDHLMYTTSRPAKILYKAIQSAANNAKNSLKTDESSLIFKHLSVDEGHKIKRFNPGGRGMAKPFVKRNSHINVILEPKPQKDKAMPVQQVQPEAGQKAGLKDKSVKKTKIAGHEKESRKINK